jgi:hypothetical protein
MKMNMKMAGKFCLEINAAYFFNLNFDVKVHDQGKYVKVVSKDGTIIFEDLSN